MQMVFGVPEPEKRERITPRRRRRLKLGEISTEQLGETNVEPNKENVARN